MSHRTLTDLRALLVGLQTLASVGLLAELLLLEHTEGAWQLVPLGLLGLGLAGTGWLVASRGALPVRVYRGIMLLFVAAGPLGVWRHYLGNAEFELEMVPELLGLDLFTEAMTGATPVLAPGTMLWLGLLGLAATFRHPRLDGPTVPPDTPTDTEGT